jgi:hypothetical protein
VLRITKDNRKDYIFTKIEIKLGKEIGNGERNVGPKNESIVENGPFFIGLNEVHLSEN